MTNQVSRLHPQPVVELPLEGLYLGHNLRAAPRDGRQALVYSNYVTSLDGRIAVPHPSRSGLVVPEQVANPRDWRLFQELAVQADVLISSGRYLRDYADGRAQEILQVYEDPRFTDLKEWRLDQGLTAQPALAIISGSLEFPIPEALTGGDRRVLIFTTSQADPKRVAQLEAQAGQVFVAGERSVQGQRLVEILAGLGLDTIYNATGPKVLHLLLADDVLDRLYLTHTGRVLGGHPFSSIVEGDLLEPPMDFQLERLYYDPFALDGVGQLFETYRRRR